MNVHGIGTIFAGGLGIDCFETALGRGLQRPEAIEVPHLKNRKALAYLVNVKEVPDRSLLKKMRRSDKLSKMAVLAASEAFVRSGLEDIDKKNVGIIVATGLGAHVTTFDFLDGILDYGEKEVSPTVFSNSVHNAAASYISSVLGIQGPTLTVTRFSFSFQYALQLAQAWLNDGRCDYVLAGAAEQFGNVLGYAAEAMLTPAPDGIIRPFNFKPCYHVPGEGAAFFLLSRDDSRNVSCRLENILVDISGAHPDSADLHIIDADGMMSDESLYMNDLSPDVPAAAYSPLFGSMMSGSAFNCAAGALMLKNSVCYTNPVKDNPRGIHILEESEQSEIELIQCIRYNCNGNKAVIYLKK